MGDELHLVEEVVLYVICVVCWKPPGIEQGEGDNSYPLR